MAERDIAAETSAWISQSMRAAALSSMEALVVGARAQEALAVAHREQLELLQGSMEAFADAAVYQDEVADCV